MTVPRDKSVPDPRTAEQMRVSAYRSSAYVQRLVSGMHTARRRRMFLETLESRWVLNGDITGRVFNDYNENGIQDVSESVLPNRSVYIDANNNGILDFSTDTTQSVSSANVPISIVDSTKVTSTLSVAGFMGVIVDINVSLNITHTFDADLDIYLISPTGTRVELSTDNGGGGDNFTNSTFDDESSNSIINGTAPLTGSYRPEGFLSAVDQESSNGQWTLEITDDAGGDTGTLNSWSLSITTGVPVEPFSVTNGNGDFAFFNTADGSYTIGQVLPAGWQQSSPVGNAARLVSVLGQSVVNQDFGSFQSFAARIYISSPLSVAENAVVLVPVYLSVTETSGVTFSGVSAVFDYDASRFTASNPRLGSGLGSSFNATSFDVSTPGHVSLSVQSSVDQNFGSGFFGNLFLVDLTVKPGAALGDSTLNLLDETGIKNGNGLPIKVDSPAVDGADVNDGLLTVIPKVDLQISIPYGLSVTENRTASLPVEIYVTSANGVTVGGITVAFDYDAARFTASNPRMSSSFAGWNSSFDLSAPGHVSLVATKAGGQTFTSGFFGDVLFVDLTAKPNATLGYSAVNLLDETIATDGSGVNLSFVNPIQDGLDINDGSIIINPRTDLQVLIPYGTTAAANQTLAVPVRMAVTEPNGVSVAEITAVFNYDASLFVVSNPRLGSALSGWNASTTFDISTPGHVSLVATTSQAHAFSYGTYVDLFFIDFTVKSAAPLGYSTINLLDETIVSDSSGAHLLLSPPILDVEDVNDGAINIIADSPPEIYPPPNQTILEDSATGVLNFTVFDDYTYNVQVTATSSNPAVIPLSGLTLGNSGSYRSLVVSPTTNASGLVTINLTATDSVNHSTTVSFVVNVLPVNDTPSFVVGGDLQINQDAGPHTVPNWATNISTGSPDEASQLLTFSTTNNNPALFSAAPTIGSNGTLTFTPAAGKNGKATVTVLLSDDGGTANGGVSTTVPQTFVIRVVSPFSSSLTGHVLNEIDNQGLSDREVFIDLDDDGILDSGVSTARTISNNVSLGISDLTKVTSLITASGFVSTIADLDVTVNIAHTYDGDVKIFLTSPVGTRIELSTSNGGSGDNYTDTTFDDEGTLSITTGVTPFFGRYRPEGALSVLDGQNPNGLWTLEISDTFSGDSGTLFSWSLSIAELTEGEPTATTDRDGYYEFLGLDNGSYNVRQVLPSGWAQSFPLADGPHVVTLVGLPEERDFRAQPSTVLHTLYPSPSDFLQAGEQQGRAVAISSQYRVVGAHHTNLDGYVDHGVVRVYDSRNSLFATLQNPLTQGSQFGWAVALSDEIVVVGAYGGDTAFVYDLTSNNPTVPWLELHGPSSSFFGLSVAVSGNYVAVGALNEGAGAGSVYVYDLSSVTPNVPMLTLRNPRTNVFDRFGQSVAISGNHLVVGGDAYFDGPGSAYVFDVTSATPQVPIVTLNPPAGYRFGYSSAISGNLVAVGGFLTASLYDLSSATPSTPIVTHQSNTDYWYGYSVAINDTYFAVAAWGANNESGRTYVYDMQSPGVPVIQVLDNPSPQVGDHFGSAVAISGARLLIGADLDDNGAENTGNAYVFNLAAATPQTSSVSLGVLAPQPRYFGRAVAAAGDYVVVGADGDYGNVGAAYVYDVTTGKSLATLRNPTPVPDDEFGNNDNFGFAVAVSGDYIVVGDYLDDPGATDAGSVYVYDLSSETPTTPVLTLSNPAVAPKDQFGWSVGISGDYLVVGAPLDDATGVNSGTAYVYNLSSSSPSIPIITLANPSPSDQDQFGSSVAVFGKYLVVGAEGEDDWGSNSGSVYVYDLSSGTPSTPIASLHNPTPGFADYFGRKVSISDTFVIVGAEGVSSSATEEGAAYVFRLDSFATTPVVLSNPTPAFGDHFGNSVAVSGEFMIVGANSDDTGANDSGSVYIFDSSGILKSTRINPSPTAHDQFGVSVAAWGKYALVGGLYEDTRGLDQGAVYVIEIANASLGVALNGGDLTITDNKGDNNQLNVRVVNSGANLEISSDHELFDSAPAGGSLGRNGQTLTLPITLVTGRLVFNAGRGDDKLTVDLSGGNSIPPNGITLNGGLGNDSLQILGGITGTETYRYDGFGDGHLSSSVYGQIDYTELEAIANRNSAADVSVQLPVGITAVTVEDDGIAGNGLTRISDNLVTMVTTDIKTPANSFALTPTLPVVFPDDAGRAYAYDLASGTSVPAATIDSRTPGLFRGFGGAVATSGDYVVVGSLRNDFFTSESGRVDVYNIASPTPTTPIATLLDPANDGSGISNGFGFSVAISNNYVVVGALHDSTGGFNSGSVFVYDLASATPETPIATLLNPLPDSDDQFGNSVAVFGNYVIVGAAGDDTLGFNTGIAWVYDLSSVTPSSPIALLLSPNPDSNDQFGNSVAISNHYAIVGAASDDTGEFDAGSAYVFDLTSTTPGTLIATLPNPAPASFDQFGFAVAISGNYVVATAVYDDAGAPDAGSAYVYDLTSATPSVPIVTLPNPTANVFEQFGFSAAISGNHVVVGANLHSAAVYGEGSAYIYDLTSGTPSVPVRTIQNPTLGLNDQFGFAVAISGNRVIVGSNGYDTPPLIVLPTLNIGPVSDLSSSLIIGSEFAPFVKIELSGNLQPGPFNSISMYGESITSTGKIETDGGDILLSATGDITLYTPLDAHGGLTSVRADSDSDGHGIFSQPTLPKGFTDPHPSVGNNFGESIVTLPSGNVVITAPHDDLGGTDAGAVYLFDGTTGNLISTLTGSHPGDELGRGGIVVLTNGNYVILSPNWNNNQIENVGAVTWGSGINGLNGVVDETNSLIGGTSNDTIGSDGVVPLNNGNYLVRSPFWDNGGGVNAGAVTWGDGLAGISGVVASNNSLVGSTSNDRIGSGGVMVLKNGNFVVTSSDWDNATAVDAGAVTWGNGTLGVRGLVSDQNSLVGSSPNDHVGNGGVTELSFAGNFVVRSSDWDRGPAINAGAVTFVDGYVGMQGTISAANSLVGSRSFDFVGFGGVQALPYGYLVVSHLWDRDLGALNIVTNAGAVTFGDEFAGIVGEISSSNSYVGGHANDQIGNGGVVALSNGIFVVISPDWDRGSADGAGAVTWSSISNAFGEVSAANSLVGSKSGDHVGGGGVVELANGNYVVLSPDWDRGPVADVGAATWVNGVLGLSGQVSAANSLVGIRRFDHVGSGGVAPLSNGSYVVISPNWDNGAAVDAGAATWGANIGGVSGAVSIENSLIGSTSNDHVGSGGVMELAQGNFLILSPTWDLNPTTDVGAVTWGSSVRGISGLLNAQNSLVGSANRDIVGEGGITVLANGNYVVSTPNWGSGNYGAITWGDGSSGISGMIGLGNSLVGSNNNDHLGSGGVVALASSNYVVVSPVWDKDITLSNVGAVTWGSGTTGVSGRVDSTNSLVGGSLNDQIGSGGVVVLSNGNYVVMSPNWDKGVNLHNVGAVTWGSGFGGVNGLVSVANSLIGTSENDLAGSGGFMALPNGEYVVFSPLWDKNTESDAGAVTWGSGSAGIKGEISTTNSELGTAADAHLNLVTLDPVHGTFLGHFANDGGGRVLVGTQSLGFNSVLGFAALHYNAEVAEGESQLAFLAGTSFPWHNAIHRSDVDGDGDVDIADVLAIIYYFNSLGSGTTLNLTPRSSMPTQRVDIVADNVFDIRDVLFAVYDFGQTNPKSAIRENSGLNAEGESAVAVDVQLDVPSLLATELGVGCASPRTFGRQKQVARCHLDEE